MTGERKGGRDGGPDFELELWRKRIPLLENAVPMNACSRGAMTGTAREALGSYASSWGSRGMDWERWLDEVERARALFAELIGARPDEVAVSSSVSAATNSVASALDYDGGRDGVVVTAAEFPTVARAWLARRRDGARVERLPLEEGGLRPEAYERAVDDDTLLVAACHAHYRTGFLQDLEAVAERVHRAGALLYVDAYQTAGAVPVDVKRADVDFLSSGCLKFLLGTSGIAFLYVAPRLIERLEPRNTGWFGQRDPFDFGSDGLDWAPDASRFELGTPPVPAAYAARAGLEAIHDVGVETIRSWTLRLGRRLADGGRERGLELVGPEDPARRNPTAAFRCPDGGAEEVADRMRERGVIAAPRGSVVRLSPHFYNTREDVDRALDALAECAGA